MLGEIVGLLSSVISGVASSGAHDDYAAALAEERRKAKTPDSVIAASEIYRGLSNTGLQNYEQQKEDIQTQLPTSLSAIRESVSSGSLIDYLAKASSQQSKDIRQLNTADATAKLQNKQNYAEFLGGRQGMFEAGTQQTQRDLGISIAKEGMDKTKDNLMFANTGSQSLDPTSAVSDLMGKTDLLGIIASLFGGKSKNWWENEDFLSGNFAESSGTGLTNVE